MFRTAAGALAATLLAVVVPASPAQAAAAPALIVEVVTANGSGCPNSPATARVLGGSSFAIDFSGYFAYAGSDAPATAFRRNCQFSIQVDQPAGWTYAVAVAQYSGFALLNEGVTGLQRANYYFQGQSATEFRSHTFTGPLADSWETIDVFTPAQLTYAPCGALRLLNLNTELRVTPQPASAGLNAMVMDPSLTLHLVWRQCG